MSEPVKLTDLNPGWVGAGGPGITNAKTGEPVPERKGVGLCFDCPCGCGMRGFVSFENPLDGGPSIKEAHSWRREGEDFESLTLHPSVHRNKKFGGCGWHGWLRDGVFTEC